jgi:8-oxo-dGTP diphosphatase
MLPTEYLITAEEDDDDVFIQRLTRALDKDGVRLVQLRAKALSGDEYVARARKALALCREYGAKLLLNGEPSLLEQIDADGIHLTSERLLQLDQRPVPAGKWLGASTHNTEQLDKAAALDCDLVTLSPLAPTPSHPDAILMGWHDFQQHVEHAGMPVFALGGMTRFHANRARAVGAQGIASIRDFWR